jgi:uncharacterized glyoxalase superfamily protein PhnB
MPKYPINSIAPLFQVADVGRSVAWYRNVFGFEAHTFPKQPPYVFAVLNCGPVEIMLKHNPCYEHKPPEGAWDAYVRLTGNRLREVYAELREKGVVVRPLERMFYGDAEFDVRDPDGYVLCVSEFLSDASDIAARQE